MIDALTTNSLDESWIEDQSIKSSETKYIHSAIETLNTRAPSTSPVNRAPLSLVHSDTPHSIPSLPSQYGNKAANLICIQEILEPLACLVPSFLPLSHNELQRHLDTYAPSWRKLWTNAYLEKEKDFSKSELKKLQTLIENCFSMHLFSSPELITWLENFNSKDKLTVRSSSLEDSNDIANPGGNISCTDVPPTQKSISENIGYVLASYVSYKSLKQRVLLGDNPLKPIQFSALLQHAIKENSPNKKPLYTSGVAYSSEHAVAIDASYGHGEGIVNGTVACDHYLVSPSGQIFPKIQEKNSRVFCKKSSVSFLNNPSSYRHSSSLPPEAIKSISKATKAIETFFKQKMDIEFVYDLENKQLYIVQARPVPKPLTKELEASSIRHDKILKFTKTYPSYIGSTLTSVSYNTQFLDSPKELLIADTINEALNTYLQENKPKYKLVVIKTPAPEFSHESAQFNQMGVHVLYLKDSSKLQNALKKTRPCLLFDPQRALVADLSLHAEKDSKYLHKSLFNSDSGFLTKGLIHDGNNFYTSSIAIQDYLPENKSELLNFSKEYTKLEEVELQSLFSSSHSIKALEHFSAKSQSEVANKIQSKLKKSYYKNILGLHSNNTEIQKNHLKKILNKLSLEFKKAPHHRLQGLLTSSLLISLEIDRYIKMEKPLKKEEQLFFLKLISALENLIFSTDLKPSDDSLFSYFLYQEKKKSYAKELKKVDIEYQKKHLKRLSEVDKALLLKQLDLSQQFIQSKAATSWKHFVFEAFLNQKHSKVQRMLGDLKTRGLLACYLNQVFAQSSSVVHKLYPNSKKYSLPIFEYFYKRLGEQHRRLLKEEQILKIKEKQACLERWEQKLELWQDPELFNSLFKEFQKDFIQQFKSLSFKKNTNLLARKKLLQIYIKMIDLYDKSIKSLKMSRQYTLTPDLLLERFKSMLTPFLLLMNSRIKEIPINASIWSKYKHRGQVIAKITEAFKTLSKEKNLKQLNSTPGFSVAAAKLGSDYKFKYAFESFFEKGQLTLEDIFSLIHQNLLSSAIYFGRSTIMSRSLLPEPLHPLVSVLRDNRGKLKLSLLNIEQEDEILTVSYNSPQNEHSFTLDIIYNLLDKSATVDIKLFGKNYYDRLARLVTELILERKCYKLPYDISVPINGRLNGKWTPSNPQEVRIKWNLNQKVLLDRQFLENNLIELFHRHMKLFPLLYCRGSARLIKEITTRYQKRSGKSLDMSALIRSCRDELKKYGPCYDIATEGLKQLS